MNTSTNRLQLAMLSGNGFSIQIAEDETAVVDEIRLAKQQGRMALFKGVDEAKTIVRVNPDNIEGFMMMPEQPRSELAIARGTRVPLQ